MVGSVSGGCIEDDLIARVHASGIAADARPEALKYGVTAEEAHRFGLPCGGTIQLVLEPLTRDSGIAALCAEVGRPRHAHDALRPAAHRCRPRRRPTASRSTASGS